MEGYQVGQAQLSLGESIQATLYHLVHGSGNGSRGWLLHRHPRVQSEADQPVVLWVLLPEDESDICFPPIFRHLFESSYFFKGCQKWPQNDISQLCQHSWVHPIRAYGLMYVQFKYSLTWSSSTF